MGTRSIALGLLLAAACTSSPTRPPAPAGPAVDTFHVGGAPSGIGVAGGLVWVAHGRRSVTGLDPESGEVVERVRTGVRAVDVEPQGLHLWLAGGGDGGAPDGAIVRRGVGPYLRVRERLVLPDRSPYDVEVGPRGVWAIDGSGRSLWRLDATRVTIERTVRLPVDSPRALQVRRRSVWVVTAGSTGAVLARVERRGGRVHRSRLPHHTCPAAVLVRAGYAWVADYCGSAVLRVDVDTRETSAIQVGRRPAALAAGGGRVWVAASGDGTVSALDPRSGRVLVEHEVGEHPRALTVTRAAVWVANFGDGTVSRIEL